MAEISFSLDNFLNVSLSVPQFHDFPELFVLVFFFFFSFGDCAFFVTFVKFFFVEILRAGERVSALPMRWPVCSSVRHVGFKLPYSNFSKSTLWEGVVAFSYQIGLVIVIFA